MFVIVMIMLTVRIVSFLSIEVYMITRKVILPKQMIMEVLMDSIVIM
jgi:hypothetical protein